MVIKSVSYSESIYKALVFLVISCPCSIAISVPLSYFSGIGKSSKEGILVKGSDYLDGIKNINKILGLSSELFPISLKYEIFAKMLEYDSELTFDDVTVEQYLSEIVKARNTLAHKKLDVCRTQEYILYYDTMRQLEARKCPEDCIEHSENYKISINEWNELRKKIHAFGNEVDETQKKLQKIEAETN